MGNAGSTWAAASGSTDVSFFAGFCQWRWRQRRAARWALPGIYVTVLLGEGLGNGQWRRTSSTCFQEDASPAPGLILTCQLGEGQWAMEPMERATDPGNI